MNQSANPTLPPHGGSSSVVPITTGISGVLGKRKTPPSINAAQPGSSSVNGEIEEMSTGSESKYDDDVTISSLESAIEKRAKIELPQTVNPKLLEQINKEMLCSIGPSHSGEYYCTLCHTRLNGAGQLERHTVANEHLRRIVSLTRDKAKAHSYCEVCYCACSCEAIFQNHLAGKKHAKNMESYMHGQSLRVIPLGKALKKILHKDVVAEGNGLTLGLSKSMTSFFNLKGPFIGLQHALETGKPQEGNPTYVCTLCNVAVDANNFQLHFTSSAHRINVLKTDYPDKYKSVLKTANSMATRGDFNAHLREVATDIEAIEGKKIELIKRKILRDPNDRSQGQGRGGSSQPRGQRGQGKGSGYKRQDSRWNQPEYDYDYEDGYQYENYPEQYYHSSSNRGSNSSQILMRGGGSRGAHTPRGNRGSMQYQNTSRNWSNGDFTGGDYDGGNFTPRGRGANRGSNRGHFGRHFQEDWTDDNPEAVSEFRGHGWRQDGWRQDAQSWSNESSRGRGFGSGNHGWTETGSNRGRRAKRGNSYSYNNELFGDYPTESYSHNRTPVSSSQYSTVPGFGTTSYTANQSSAYTQATQMLSQQHIVHQQQGRQMLPRQQQQGKFQYSSAQVSPMIPGPAQIPINQQVPLLATPNSHPQVLVNTPPVSRQTPLLATPTDQSQGSATLDPVSILNTLASSSIVTDADAEAAFKISTALTQALLAYRLKNVAKDMEYTPSHVMSLLNNLQRRGGAGGSGEAGGSANTN